MDNNFGKNKSENGQNLLSNMFGLGIEGEVRNKLYTITTWSRITAVTGFVNLVLSLLVTFISYQKESRYRNSSLTLVTAVVSLVIGFFLNYFLLKFSSHLRKSLDGDDSEEFTSCAMHLKSYMRMLGILLIITILVTILSSGFLVMMGARF